MLILLTTAVAEPAYALMGADRGCMTCTKQLSDIGATAKSSSSLGAKYAASAALDGDPATAWCEGVNGSGVGEWIEVAFAEPVDLDIVDILGGFFKSAELLAANGRVMSVDLVPFGQPHLATTVADPTVLPPGDAPRPGSPTPWSAQRPSTWPTISRTP